MPLSLSRTEASHEFLTQHRLLLSQVHVSALTVSPEASQHLFKDDDLKVTDVQRYRCPKKDIWNLSKPFRQKFHPVHSFEFRVLKQHGLSLT